MLRRSVVFVGVFLLLLCFVNLHAKEYRSKFIGVLCDSPDETLFNLNAALGVALKSVEQWEYDNVVYEMSGKVESLSPQDAVEAGNAACIMMAVNPGMSGVIAPFNSDSLRHVQAVCDFLDVPLLITQPLPDSTRSWTAINLFPHYSAFTEAVVELIKFKEWKSFTVIYEDPEGLERMTDILAMHSESEQYVISVRQLPDGDNYRSLLLVMKDSEAENFIVDCKIESARKFLEQAQQVGIISEPYAYIFTNPDLQTLDLDRYSHGGANITGFRIFDVTSPTIVEFTNSLKVEYNYYFDALGIPNPHPEYDWFLPERLPSVLPLTYDAVRLLAVALGDLKALNYSSDGILDCETGSGLIYGSALINHMRTMKQEGLTGLIQFDENGDRSVLVLEVLELIEDGVLLKVGNWSKINGAKKDQIKSLVIERPMEHIVEDDSDTMRNKTFIVLISLTPPYGMQRESTEKLYGNDQYEGFCVELIQELSAILGFNYIFEVQEDGNYGSYNSTTKEWNGMLRKVIDGTVDFAITDLTITSEREGAVDFTTPFMNLGISILYRAPEKPRADPFSFLLPFSNGVWFSLGGVYIACSVLLYLLGRICPDEWQNPYPCVEEPETLENQFTLANALWFNLGAILLQGSEIAPVAYGTRAAASMWWFFALIITSSYTANLASLLSIANKFEAIHNAAELANNPYNISYGAKKGGSTYSFFEAQGPNNELFKQMYDYMAANPSLLCSSNDHGTKRVLEENYAFLMESTSIEYLVERNCNLTQIGGLLDNKGYGLAMKKESVYRQKLNLALLNLQEQGKLANMKKKWWKEKRGGGICVEDDEMKSDKLGLVNVGGVFIVLVVGCVFGILVSFFDMTLHVYRRAKQDQVRFIDEFKSEIKFVFTFNATEKPLRRSRSGTESNQARILRRLNSSSDRDSNETHITTESQEPTPEIQTPERRQSDKINSRRTSIRSRTGRRRSTIHDNSIRLARQSTRE